MRAALCAFSMFLCAVVPKAQAQSAENTGPRFDIRRFVVQDATLLPKAQIDAAVKPFAGKQRDFSAVQGAIRALEKAYADAGYTAIQVILPEQELRDGRVKLKVRELKLGTVAVEGNQNYGEANIRRSLPSLVPGEPPNVDAIARNLRIANDNPSKNTTALLRAGASDDTVDVVARVSDRSPVRGAVSLDSTGTPSTGIIRAGVSVQHANVFDRDHVASAQLIGSPLYPNRVTILGLGYRIPLYERGDSVEFGYVYSDVNSGQVSTAAGQFGISGGGNFYTARYNFNLPRRGDWDHRLVFGADWREYTSNVTFGTGGPSLVPDITVHPLSAGYVGRRRTQQDDLSFFVNAFRNIPGGAAGGVDAFNKPGARPGSNPSYLLWRFGASYLKTLPRDFQARVAVNGQYTNDLLIAGEQFGIGGMDSVRGFIEREIANDRGLRSTAELYGPEFGLGADRDFRTRGLVFVDYGYASRIRPLTGEKPSESIASYGVGLRAYYRDRVSLRLDYGSVYLDGGQQGKNDMRLHGSLSVFF